MDRISVPDRAALCNLPILGMGTPDVESMPSYLLRLAQHHEVTVGRIMTGQFVTQNESCTKAKKVIHGARFKAKAYKGLLSSKLGKKVCEALSVIVGVELVQTTLHKLQCACSTTRLIENCARWCPLCIQSDRIPYLRSYWGFAQVNTCAIHGVSLHIACASCNHAIPIFNPRAKKLECSRCGSPLTVGGPKSHNQLGAEHATIVRRFVGEFNYGSPLSAEALCTAFSRLAANRPSIPASQALGVAKSSWSGWKNKRHSLSAAVFIDVCLRQNVDIVDLVHGRKVYPSPAESSACLGTWLRGKQRKSPQVHSADQLQRRVTTFLSRSPALSVLEIATILKVATRELYRLAPRQCHEITRKKRLENRAKRQEIVEARKRQISTIFSRLHQSGITPSVRNVGKRLDKPGLLRHKELRRHLYHLRGL